MGQVFLKLQSRTGEIAMRSEKYKNTIIKLRKLERRLIESIPHSQDVPSVYISLSKDESYYQSGANQVCVSRDTIPAFLHEWRHHWQYINGFDLQCNAHVCDDYDVKTEADSMRKYWLEADAYLFEAALSYGWSTDTAVRLERAIHDASHQLIKLVSVIYINRTLGMRYKLPSVDEGFFATIQGQKFIDTYRYLGLI